MREIDPERLDTDDYQHERSLRPGDEYYIETKLSGESNTSRLIRFRQI